MRLLYSLLDGVYGRTVLSHPFATVLVCVLLGVFFASRLPDLKLDASSDALLLKNDPVLRIYDRSRLVFGSDDYVIAAFESDDLFTPAKVGLVSRLTERFRAIEGVESVLSLTTERLFQSPPAGGGAMGLIAQSPVYLDSPACNLAMARRELTGHEVYSQNLVTPDGRKASFIIYLVFTFEEKWLEKEMYSIEEYLAGGDPTRVVEESIEEFESVFRSSPVGVADVLAALGSELVKESRQGAGPALSAAEANLEAYQAVAGESEAKSGEILATDAAARLMAALSALEDSLSAGSDTASPAMGILRNRLAVASERLAESGRGAGVLRNLLSFRADKARLRERHKTVKRLYDGVVDQRRIRRTQALERIRAILAETGEGERYHLAGLPIIWVDMMRYIRNDMKSFGVAGGLFLLLALGLVFRRIRYVLFPMAACLTVMAAVVGTMALLDLKTTVITSNIASLLLILSMSQAIHILVKYEERLRTSPFESHVGALRSSLSEIALPCFHISSTTAIGFISMVTTGIVPVIQFGEFMAVGVMLSFAVCFVLVPAGLLLFPMPILACAAPGKASPLSRLAVLPHRMKVPIICVSVAAAAASVIGITGFKPLGLPGLGVETVFVDYFNKGTDIYKGLIFVDQKMGGTSSLEVLLDGGREGFFAEKANFEKIGAVERFFRDLPHVGKVISVRSMTAELEKILEANGQPPPGKAGYPPKFLLGLLSALGSRGGERAAMWSYVSRDFSTARVFVRIRESDRDLNRNEMVAKVKDFVSSSREISGLKAEVTGVFVLYANMLNSLIGGQVNSFGLVFAAIFLTFAILFRSLKVALIAMTPNLIPIFGILGLMGYLHVPLDMNNIMMASVAMGIAVDDTIHYIFRFKKEVALDGDYVKAMYRSHGTIGKAIVLTTVVNVAGFGVLVFSNFKPTIFFGFFTAFALVVALAGVTTLLPALIILVKPFGKDPRKAGAS